MSTISQDPAGTRASCVVSNLTPGVVYAVGRDGRRLRLPPLGRRQLPREEFEASFDPWDLTASGKVTVGSPDASPPAVRPPVVAAAACARIDTFAGRTCPARGGSPVVGPPPRPWHPHRERPHPGDGRRQHRCHHGAERPHRRHRWTSCARPSPATTCPTPRSPTTSTWPRRRARPPGDGRHRCEGANSTRPTSHSTC
jgi:hypothetical protein